MTDIAQPTMSLPVAVRQIKMPKASEVAPLAIGTFLTLIGFTARGAVGMAGAGTGLFLIYKQLRKHDRIREKIETPIKSMLGAKASEFSKVVTINASKKAIFDLIGKFEDLPKFQDVIRGVDNLGEGKFILRIFGPIGTECPFELNVIDWRPDESLSVEFSTGDFVSGDLHMSLIDSNVIEGACELRLDAILNMPLAMIGRLGGKVVIGTFIEGWLFKIKQMAETGEIARGR